MEESGLRAVWAEHRRPGHGARTRFPFVSEIACLHPLVQPAPAFPEPPSRLPLQPFCK